MDESHRKSFLDDSLYENSVNVRDDVQMVRSRPNLLPRNTVRKRSSGVVAR